MIQFVTFLKNIQQIFGTENAGLDRFLACHTFTYQCHRPLLTSYKENHHFQLQTPVAAYIWWKKPISSSTSIHMHLLTEVMHDTVATANSWQMLSQGTETSDLLWRAMIAKVNIVSGQKPMRNQLSWLNQMYKGEQWGQQQTEVIFSACIRMHRTSASSGFWTFSLQRILVEH